MGQAWKRRSLYLFTFHWLEDNHMATPNRKGVWEMQCGKQILVTIRAVNFVN